MRIVLAAFGAAALTALTACATEPLGPPGPPMTYAPGQANVFRPGDFAWSTAPGPGVIRGSLSYHDGAMRYSCEGRDVILTPETAWTRRRMIILYGSPTGAAVPLEIVRARTPSAPSGDYASYVRKTTCDRADRFSFTGLPSGGWFVITLAKPVDGEGETVAVMRRVEVRGGPRSVVLD